MGALQRAGMGLISKKFDVWRRLYSKFDLDPGVALADRAEVASFIIPVVDVDAILDEITIESFTVLGEVGNVEVVTIPSGERWSIQAIAANRVAGDRLSIGVLAETPESATLGPDMFIFTVTASSALQSQGTSVMRTLELPGDAKISMQFSSAGSTNGNWDIKLLVTKREVRSSD